jgi:hypothetical protein
MAEPDLVLCISIDPRRRVRMEELAGKQFEIHEGSVPGKCSRCRAAVWIGPRSFKALISPKYQAVCETCIANAVAAGWVPDSIRNLERED